MVDFGKYCVARKAPTKAETSWYLEEVGGLCPICGTPLVVAKGKQLRNQYEIAHVFPNSPTLFEQELLKNVEVAGENSEDMLNKIALCYGCHKEYDAAKTVESYYKMYHIKADLNRKMCARRAISNQTIESELTNIVENIAMMKEEDLDLPSLSMEALTIDQKIEKIYGLLRNKIKNDVTQYYGFVREQFRNLDISASRFNIIAQQVKCAYMQLKEAGLNKNDIYSQMTDWFVRKTSGGHFACEIIVSFFVQNCEIYEELPE